MPLLSDTDELETLSKLTPLLSQLGITRVANVTGLDRVGIPVAVCIRPHAKHLSVAQGKGLTWEEARISAIMESIEAYHAETPAPPDLVGTYQQLQSHVELLDLARLSGGFFQWNADRHSLEWLAAKELIHQRTIYIPRDIVCLDSSRCRPFGALFAVSSTGLAAGNTYEEAILHGLYEVIERDALWHWQRLPREVQMATSIAIDSMGTGASDGLIQQLLAAEFTIVIREITSTLGVPAYYCVIADADSIDSLGVFHGSGAHLDADVALAKALLEAAQSRLTYITGTREEIFPGYYAGISESCVPCAVPPTLTLPHKTGGGNSMSPPPVLWGRVRVGGTALSILKERLATHDFTQLIVLDHTKPELSIPVVHVIVPGMRSGAST